MPAPLRKHHSNGDLYQRDPAVEAQIALLTDLSAADLDRACAAPKLSADYVRSECILYLIRQASREGRNAEREHLHKILFQRLLRQCPRMEAADGNTASALRLRVQETMIDRFTELLMSDRRGYEERLDFYEVRFGAAVAALRADAERKAHREERKAKPLMDEVTGDIRATVEAAAGADDPFAVATKYATDYRSRLDASIDRLPTDQREIIDMLFREQLPIESKDSAVVSIVSRTGLSEKTVRNRRDRALVALRQILTEEDAS